jgi:DNA-binding CsgD family transcriptional regulator
MVLVNIAQFYSRRGELSQAEATAAEAVGLMTTHHEYPRTCSDVHECYAGILADQGDFENALIHAKQAIEAIRPIAIDVELMGALSETLVRLGKIYLRFGNLPEAGEAFKESYAIERHRREPKGLFRSNASLAEFYLASNNVEASRKFTQQAHAAAEQIDDPMMIGAMHEFFYRMHKDLGDYQIAITHLEKYQMHERLVFTSETEVRCRMLEIRHTLQKKEQESEIQRLQLEQLQHQLEIKQRELAAQAMHLARQTELLGSFRNELRAILRETDKAEQAIKAIKERLKALPCESIDWAKFEAEFQATHPEFRAKLVERYPGLTKMEVKTCSLLKLKLTSADIATLFCLSERSVETHRSNIRRKLALKRGEDLYDVLSRI